MAAFMDGGVMAEQAIWQTNKLDMAKFEALMIGEQACRMATINTRGPHITPTGFIWDGQAVWVASQTMTQRFVDLQRDPRVCVLVEPGDRSAYEGYVEIIGEARVVGSIPCMGDDDETKATEELWIERIGFNLDLVHDSLHAWVRIEPQKVVQMHSVIANHDSTEYLEESRRVAEARELSREDR
jgi:general stress protein 26